MNRYSATTTHSTTSPPDYSVSPEIKHPNRHLEPTNPSSVRTTRNPRMQTCPPNTITMPEPAPVPTVHEFTRPLYVRKVPESVWLRVHDNALRSRMRIQDYI